MNDEDDCRVEVAIHVVQDFNSVDTFAVGHQQPPRLHHEDLAVNKMPGAASEGIGQLQLRMPVAVFDINLFCAAAVGVDSKKGLVRPVLNDLMLDQSLPHGGTSCK